MPVTHTYYGKRSEMKKMDIDNLFDGFAEAGAEPVMASSCATSLSGISRSMKEDDGNMAKLSDRIMRIKRLFESDSSKEESCEKAQDITQEDAAVPERSRTVGRKGKLFRFNEERYNQMKEDDNFRLEF